MTEWGIAGLITLIFWGLVTPYYDMHLVLGNDLVHNQHQAITWGNAHVLSIGPLETNLRKVWIAYIDAISEAKQTS